MKVYTIPVRIQATVQIAAESADSAELRAREALQDEFFGIGPMSSDNLIIDDIIFLDDAEEAK